MLRCSSVMFATLKSVTLGVDRVIRDRLLDFARLDSGTHTGFAHAGWKYDRYSSMPSLDARNRMVVADIKGPGVIRHIHVTRHKPKDLTSRGVVLEIWFDEAEMPAVHVPLADFFGDGCNGAAMDFSSAFIECAPQSYNSYFVMPFKSRAIVALRNDTDMDLANYSYVEYEPLDTLDDRLGYFHATYQRRSFQLNRYTDETMFEVEGRGHLFGRQFSIVTDEPLFTNFEIVMEGNNSVDIDGELRKIDYLGTEDSFTFSWGFQRQFAGVRAGIPFVKLDTPSMLSVFRFHDHVPIRFNESLRWRIDWTHERLFFEGWENPSDDENAPWGSRWASALLRNGCKVDYATVFYWYQNIPGGYCHQALPDVSERG